jgi:glycogen operon protein
VVRRRRAVAGVHPWLKESAGRSHPLGATVSPDGVNFSVFSRGSAAVHLLLFDGVNDEAPSRVITLDPHDHRTYHYWHAFVPDVRPGQAYAYRAEGPWDPARGFRFDRGKVLLDPYGKCVVAPALRSREAATRPGDNTATAFRNVVVDAGTYDWGDDRPPQTPFTRTVIYEMHVGAFTRHPSSGVGRAKRGSYAGAIEKIPYLLDLGVTAVELLPVFAFDDQDAPAGLRNDWGYAPVSFFAPHEGYSSRRDALGAVDEFRDMVKAMHRAGIEVILDVVYNHTAEGNDTGPTLCFRGLANGTYYILGADKRTYADYSGCGNTLNANDPIVRRLILDSLRYWVSEMHVDGFRFDLASILTRDAAGQPMATPPVLWDIESDPVLANVKLIAEAWDAAGLYQVGSFAGDSWKEWNGQFRDDVRAFLKGDGGRVQGLASRVTGSPDIYAHEHREPEQSINFVTCHDGFTLNDLVTYNTKHNDANGEDNRDGTDDNRSWNCGVEGPTDDQEIERLRDRQVKNFLTLLLVGVGTPMLLMGDEVRRTQRGNNNAYCQNSEISWFDWSLVDARAGLRRFVKTLIHLRTGRRVSDDRPGLTLVELLRRQPIAWHGVRLHEPDWSYDSHTLAMTAELAGGTHAVHLIVNAYWEPLEFAVPRPPIAAATWRLLVDTWRDAPDDVHGWSLAPAVDAPSYAVQPRTVVLLGAGSVHADDNSSSR